MHRSLLVAFVIATAACSSGDGSATEPPASAGSVSTEPAATEPSTAAPVVTTSPATTTPTTDPAQSAWCDLSRQLDALQPNEDEMLDPKALERYVDQSLAMIADGRAVVPGELADDLEVAVASFERFREALAAVDFNIIEADFTGLRTPESDAAEDRLDAYDAEVCGIVDDESSGDAFNPDQGSIAEQFVASLTASGFTAAEAECVLANLDFADPAVQQGAAAPVLVAFEACGIDQARLEEIDAGG